MKVKFDFHENLYLGEGIAVEKVDKIKRKLARNPLMANVYLIVPAGNPMDQLDIYEAGQFAQPHYRNMTFCVIGIASGYQEALLLIEQMVQECLAQRGDCKLREYLSC